MSEQSLQLLQRIRLRMAETARRMTMADLLFGLAVSLGIASGVCILSVGLEAGFWLDTPIRTGLFWIVAALIIGLFVYFVFVPLLRLAGVLEGPSAQFVADRIGTHFPEVGDRLINLLDLSEGRRTDSPDTLVDGAVQMLGREVEPVSFERVETFSRPRRAVRMAAIPLASLLLFVAAAPSTFVDASKRLLSPGTHFQAPAPFSLVVKPGNFEIAKGASMEIQIRAQGEASPRFVSLSLQNADEEHVEEVRLSADSTGIFRHQLANVRRSFQYRASAHPVTSAWFRAEVTEHPLVRSLQVTVEFPSYSGIPAQRLDANVGDVTALPGSSVKLDVQIGGSQAKEAFLLFDDGDVQPLELSGERAIGDFRLTRQGTYKIVVANHQGIQNRDPIAYTMGLISDAAPSVILIHPEPDAMLSDDLRALLVGRLSDDFGFRDLRLRYRLAESRYGTTSETFDDLPMPLNDARQLDQEVRFDWELAESTDLDPVPGDVIEYYLEVRDNDTYAGYKSARSAVQRLRLPSLAEQYEQLDEEQNAVEDGMEDMQRQADLVREQFQELRDEIRRKQDADWEDKRQLEQLQERQSQLEKQAQQLSEQMESMNRSMEQNNLLSDETMEMYQEMQKVIEEINSPELMDALRQLQQAVEELNLQQMQQAVEDFEFSEEQYRQRLERSLELFKNLRTQQALEEAARRAEELAKQQERLAEETEKLEEGVDEDRGSEDRESKTEEGGEKSEEGEDEDRGEVDRESGAEEGEEDRGSEGEEEDESDSPKQEENQGAQKPSGAEKLAQDQERSKEEMEQLQELLEQIREQMDELQKGPKQEMQQLNQSVQQQQIPQKMQQNAEQLRQQQMQEAQQGQQQMQQQLQQLQSQLSQMRQGMQGQQMQMNMAGLRRALSDVLTLSQKQEELRAGVRNTVSDTPSLRDDARQQVELSEGLATVIDSLQRLSKDIPQMSREVQRHAGMAVREMSESTEAMTERSVGEASGHQKASMMHLNELALMLSEVMNQMMNASGSGSGGTNMQQMIQQMQQMAGQQQKLNQQIQQFLNDAQGNRLSTDMQQRLQQMGEQQQAIRQQLEELRRNPEARGKLLGDLDKISQQMEETIRELEQRQVEPRMIERQQQILQRLLDAQRSINQRGKEDKRESREGRDVTRESPGDLPPEEAAEKLRRDLIEALESGYAPDYEELIKRYFELLQQQTREQE